MAGRFKNFIKKFSVEDDDYDYDGYDDGYDDDYYEDDYVDEEPKSGFFKKSSKKDADYDDYDGYDDDYDNGGYQSKSASRKSGKSSKITSINNRRPSFDAMDVRIIKPSNFDLDTHEIADNLLEQRTVILNLEGIDVGLAQRIIDFSFGACYALHGNFRAITKSILLITPSNVNISGVLDKVNESLSIADE